MSERLFIWQSKSESMYLAGLVLCDLVLGVLLAVPALAVRPPCLRNVDLRTKICQPRIRLLCAFEPSLILSSTRLIQSCRG